MCFSNGRLDYVLNIPFTEEQLEIERIAKRLVADFNIYYVMDITQPTAGYTAGGVAIRDLNVAYIKSNHGGANYAVWSAAHEIGHLFGLNHAAFDPEPRYGNNFRRLMYGYPAMAQPEFKAILQVREWDIVNSLP